jgi:hypothetical protein
MGRFNFDLHLNTMNTQAVVSIAVECFDLGPEDEDAVLRFGMKLEDMEPQTPTETEEALRLAMDYIRAVHSRDIDHMERLAQKLEALRANPIAAKMLDE